MLNSALDAAFEYAISLCKAKEADLLEAHLKNLSGLENYKYTNEDSAMQYDYTPIPTATNTPVPTATHTPEPTATNTPVPSPTVSQNSGDRIYCP